MRRRAERQLLLEMRGGRREACEDLVRRHYEAIYRFLAYLTGDGSAADDLTQETFAAAWLGIGGFEGRSTVSTWLHRIAYGKFVDGQRKNERLGRLKSEWARDGQGLREAAGPMARLLEDERSEELYRALRGLEQKDHTLIVLHYLQEKSYREMAEILEEPAGTIKWRMSRALKDLKSKLNGRV